MPPGYVMHRLVRELRGHVDRYLAPRRARRFDLRALLKATDADTLEMLWGRLGERPYPFSTDRIDRDEYERLCPGDYQRVLERAERALKHQVDLLGSGLIDLGPKIDWHRDYKAGLDWPIRYFKDIDIIDPGRPSDVKFPWELSRMQWMIPLGQAYLLTGDERYAEGARRLIEAWISANPYAQGVNWTCAMDVALRILSWSWFFRVFCRTRAWADAAFRERFLITLFLHGEFTERYIERGDINSNHFTSDAAGMVFAGLFFTLGKDAKRWHASGWAELVRELPLQVHPDGVDFEASTAYHRLVLELFLLPALYHRSNGGEIPDAYRERLVAMAGFTAAYSRPDGSVPFWGDADDGRALPFSDASINDHRYLLGAVAAALGREKLQSYFSGPRTEILWLLGPTAASRLPDAPIAAASPPSAAFPGGGVYILRSGRSHVFIDCGRVGSGGRGAHGHSDALSFEVALDGVPLVIDRGTYVYTASFEARNEFRSTSSHNTPMVDGQEINRLVHPDFLWLLREDANPRCISWNASGDTKEFRGAHHGYWRLAPPVSVERRVVLEASSEKVAIEDHLEFEGSRSISIPLHLAPGVSPKLRAGGKTVDLVTDNGPFLLTWSSDRDGSIEITDSTYSPSYGRLAPIKRINWTYTGPGPVRYLCSIEKGSER